MTFYVPKEIKESLQGKTAYFNLSGDSLRIATQLTTNSYTDIYYFPNYSEFPDYYYTTTAYNTSAYSYIANDYTSEIVASPKFDSLCVSALVIAIFVVFIINVITSFVKRGGVLGGLL